ncbi:MAG: flagellar basal body P-ring formation chaperone FlgA [Fibromonadales bacterium]|nr:flagellar basal body P-ring formation chaperone FlgA [Fibromonadales bacterium]
MKQIMLIFLILLVKAQIIFAAQVSITLKAQASVEPGVIRLGHIAEIKGDPGLAKKISDIEVGKVAEPGRKTRVTENAIKGFFIKSVAGSQDVTFDGAKFCDVVARSGQLSADSLKALLLKEVRSRMAANLKEGKDWNLEAPKIPEKLAIPESGGKILITLSPQFAGAGQEMATVQVFNGNKAIIKQNFPFIVRRFEYIAELKKGIRKGEVIGEQDFEMVWQETTFQKRKIIKKPEEATGRTAIRTLKAGELLVDNSLDTPYAVREGDVVKLFAKFGETVVQTNAVAQKSAFKGQTISVKNMDTGKSLLATISGSGEAWVN